VKPWRGICGFALSDQDQHASTAELQHHVDWRSAIVQSV
jgi:hypothetical protein